VPAVPQASVGLDVPIETKLHAPNSRPEWMERSELTGYLARSSVKLVLVDAPAGFGKTTVVAQWRSSALESRAFAWVSLDRGDDDPARLWWYIVSALQRACPQIGVEALLKELRVQAPEVTGTVLPVLANELAALPAPVVLVLDDYHVIKERSCHEQVEFLLQHLPPSAQIVLITRADPPLPLARLRAAGEMIEIRARELRFGPEEAAALVRAVADVKLGEADLADLMERTEGWPAGVYLAALSLRGHPSPQAFVREFTGDNRFIVDLLADEVLTRQPPEIRQFLARTSILSRFCAPLCDAVTGSANAADIIETLERENLFLVPLDDNRQWYRYHHLFAQLLRSQLAMTEPDSVRSLHQRASAWYQRSGLTEEAIGHALAADDIAGAVDLIARCWFSYVDTGRTATVRGWMRSLGDDRIATHPLAAHCAAWAAAVTGDRETVRRWLPLIEAGRPEGPLPDGIQSLRSSAALLRGVFGFDGLRVMRESAVTAAELECDPASPWYAGARAALGFSLYLSGDPEAAAEPLEQAVQSESSIPLIHMFALSVMTLVAVELGRASKARDFAQAARLLGSRDGLRTSPQSGVARMAMGAVHAERGRLPEARSELEPVMEARRRLFGISPWPTLELLLLLARVRFDLGDRAGAAELAAEARDVLTGLPDGTEALQTRLAALDRRIAARSRVVSLAEPLTEREEAVLRLLGGSLSLREIGQELYVSANTVKTHTQAIYRKLGVSTRHDAVARGKQLGL
jgi:LuxR family transcriptional regulator, maltose regulon positive regulatory protein